MKYIVLLMQPDLSSTKPVAKATRQDIAIAAAKVARPNASYGVQVWENWHLRNKNKALCVFCKSTGEA